MSLAFPRYLSALHGLRPTIASSARRMLSGTAVLTSSHYPAPSKSHAGLESFPHLARLSTQWRTNDAYAHANNASYGEMFDTAVNNYLIRRGVMEIDPVRRASRLKEGDLEEPVIGFMIEDGRRFFESFAYPELMCVGIRVAHLGNSSVRYEAGLFREVEPDWRDPQGKLAQLTGPGSLEHPSAQWLPDEAFNMKLFGGPDATASSTAPGPGPAAEAFLRRFRHAPCATGFFTHVYVNPTSKRPVKQLPKSLKEALELIRYSHHQQQQ